MNFQSGLIDAAGALAPPGDEQNRQIRTQAKMLAGLFPFLLQQILPHRVSRHHDAGFAPSKFRGRFPVSQCHHIHNPAENPVGYSGKGVLFLNQRGNPGGGGAPDHRTANIAASADHRIRPKIP